MSSSFILAFQIQICGDLQGHKDWELFLRNAARVQVLTHIPPARYEDDVYRLIGLARPQIHLFPQLHTLHWNDDSLNKHQNIILFLGPSLTQLILHNHAGDAALKVCEAVAYRSKYVTSLEIYNPWQSVQLGRELSRRDIYSFPPIQSLTALTCRIGGVSSPGWSSLGTLPDLAELTLDMRGLVSPIPQLPFLALQSLKLSVENSGEEIAQLFASIGAPHLTRFSITIAQGGALSKEDVYSIFTSLSTHKALSSITVDASLKSVEGKGGTSPFNSRRYRQRIQRISEATLRPLFELKGLVKLDLRKLACSISDGELESTIVEWPLITCLLLGSSCPKSGFSATFMGLHAIAAAHTTLSSLGVPLDISRLTPFATRPIASHTCTELHLIAARALSSVESIEVAALLSDIFPAASIHSCMPDQGWGMVDILIRPLVEVRREERRRLEEELESL